MSDSIKPSCSICAWRGTCNKKFSIKDPSRCIDFSLDLTLDIKPKKDKDEN
ncbi:MAG: hypothetical protein LDL13_01365 [Calditerrivibrio sp.]|nr:hypothetical protein [Calditerrivibrio sp.]MCA1932211.1 hypothetical protein [Calditerrivibrio sp.]